MPLENRATPQPAPVKLSQTLKKTHKESFLVIKNPDREIGIEIMSELVEAVEKEFELAFWLI